MNNNGPPVSIPANAPTARNGSGHGFGTAPVFLASISTILGAILFLRFGYAVGHVGFLGVLLIVGLGHLVTIPTALAIAEIATNRRVEGGGEYFIISRSFGTTIGGAIGISLYLSQAISVAFYMIAFAEAFRPFSAWLATVGITFDPRFISVPAMVALAWITTTRGAAIGVKALWGVVAVLGVSIAMFFLGSAPAGVEVSELPLMDRVADPDPFILVFAIVFPAFTGMTAGVGLSGDLANPRKSIPLGVISATVTGMLVYVAIAYKLATSAPPDVLISENPLAMSQIALWGPIIPIGLACATLSSAIGSILVAPRTLQALGGDRIVPHQRANAFLARGLGTANEPRNATLVTSAIALVTVISGNVDFVARVISMFFMVTYGALCTISTLEHFAARPSYRPSFRSKWYISLVGSVAAFLLVLQMDPFFALLAIAVMIAIYYVLRLSQGSDDLAAIFKGVMTQATRYSHIKLQTSLTKTSVDEWRPSVVMLNSRTFSRSSPLQFFTWLCHRYGFGTYLHYVPGQLNPATFRESRRFMSRLVDMTHARRSAVYVDTMISPSFRSALAQSLQFPGVSGMENNAVLFEFSEHDGDEVLAEVEEGCELAGATNIDHLVLRHTDRFFGHRGTIHIWLTHEDEQNGNLMIMLAYILLGHPDWHDAEIRIFAAVPQTDIQEQRAKLTEMIHSGRLPISQKNLRVLPTTDGAATEALIERRSASADLVIMGFTPGQLRETGVSLFRRHAGLPDVLFVSAHQRIEIE